VNARVSYAVVSVMLCGSVASCGRDAEPTPAIVISVARVISIAISPRNVATILGGQVQMHAALVADDAIVDRAVEWSTSSNVVSISATGVVTGLRAGSAVITARAHADPAVADTTVVTVFLPGIAPPI